jgi:hypothetical protein
MSWSLILASSDAPAALPAIELPTQEQGAESDNESG